MKKFLFFVLGLGVFGMVLYFFVVSKVLAPSQVLLACPLDAKICLDGSSVGRTGPNCEFTACPMVPTSLATSSVSSKSVIEENAPIEGKRLVYLRSIKQQGLSALVEVDPIEMFGGDEATALAIKDSGCSQKNVVTCVASLNNGFYIRNLSTSTQKLTLNLSTDVYLLTNSDGVTPEKVGVLELKKISETWSAESLSVTPFLVTVKNGKILTVEQRYVP